MSTTSKLVAGSRILHVKTTHILLILIVAGAFIRFFRLEYSGLWIDEIFSMLGSSPEKSLRDVYDYSVSDQPPLFFVILHYWLKFFGNTDFAGRALTCLFGLGGIVSIFFLGKEIKNEKVGLMASFITTLNWFHTDISKEIRFYPLVFLLVSLSYLFFLRSIRRQRIADFLLYAILTGLLLNTHYYGMVVFVSQMLIFALVLVFFRREGRLIIGGLAAGVIAGLSFLHFLPVIMKDSGISQFHVKQVGPAFPFEFLWSYIHEPVEFTIYLVFAMFTLAQVVKKFRQRELTIVHLVVFGWIFFGILIPLTYSLLKIPLLTPKYTTIIVPALLVIFANGFYYLKSEKLRSYLVKIITISAFVILFFARPPYKPRRPEDWREVAAYFAQRKEKSLLAYSTFGWYHQYYFPKHGLPVPYDHTNADNTKIDAAENVWLITNEKYSNGLANDWFYLQQKAIVEKDFELTDSIGFIHAKAFLYTRKLVAK
jgi:uncharacterized membrane protein